MVLASSVLYSVIVAQFYGFGIQLLYDLCKQLLHFSCCGHLLLFGVWLSEIL